MKSSMRTSFFSSVQDVIEGKKKRPIFKALLAFASVVFLTAIKLKNALYDKSLISSKRAPLKVVCIGNLTAGGTGKTPFTLLLAKELKNEKIAILSRGYRSQSENNNVLVSTESSAEEIGDEPLLLFRRLKKVPIYIGKDRFRSAVCASRRGAAIALLDDGLQHRKLAQDVKIILLDARDPWGKGHFLPRGYLRENPCRLQDADFIVLNHVSDEQKASSLKKEIASLSSAPILMMRYRLGCIRNLKREEIPLKKGIKVGAFCAIARPGSFEKTLNRLDIVITNHLFYPDHEPIDIDCLQRFAKCAKEKGADALFCTEKDAVKLPESLSLCLPIYYLEMEMELVSSVAEWQMLIEKIRLPHDNESI